MIRVALATTSCGNRIVSIEPDAAPDEGQWRALEGLLAEHPARVMLWEGEPIDETQERTLPGLVPEVRPDPRLRGLERILVGHVDLLVHQALVEDAGYIRLFQALEPLDGVPLDGLGRDALGLLQRVST